MTREEVLSRANQCVNGDRERDYGSPEDNFKVIANLWSVYKGVSFSSVDVAMMMSLLKIARIKNGGGSGDSFVDLAGYAACGGELQSVEKEPESEPTRRSSEEIWEVMSEDIKRLFGL